MQKIEMIMCPLVNREIETGDCVVYTDVAEGMLKDHCIPEEFKKNENWRGICTSCEYHNN